jgi:hypothetical protein
MFKAVQRTRRVRRVVRLVGLGLMVAVVATELKKPVVDRQWEGRIVGVVPYALRFPTPERIWRSFWDPGNPQLFVPRSFGVGWRLNLAAVEARLDRLFRRLMGTPDAAGPDRSGTPASSGSRPRQSRSRSRTNSSARP